MEQQLSLIRIPENQCSYLSDKRSTSLFIDPQAPMDMQIYSQLIEQGFRRSGALIYRPDCEHCKQCVSIKVDPQQFTPSRSQKRCLKRNSDLTVTPVMAGYSDEHFSLYERYINQRHAEGGMENPTKKAFEEFLYSDWSTTLFLEMRDEEKLIGVAVVDLVGGGLSAVYTFFDPEEHKRGLGNFAVLWQLQLARKRKLPWVYLGYWIAESQKMNYKAKYQPALGFQSGAWKTLTVKKP